MFSRRKSQIEIRDCARIPPSKRYLYSCPAVKIHPPITTKPTNFGFPVVPPIQENCNVKRCNKNSFAIVLDLDETLIHTFKPEEEPEGLFDEKNSDHYEIDLGFETMRGVKRPYLQKFIDYAFENSYPVIVWTAGRADYAQAICEKIFTKQWPAKVYTYDHCVNSKNIVKKPLSQIDQDFPHMIDRSRLVVVDDRRTAYFSNDQEHLIEINKWEGTGEDNSLEQVIGYLENIKKNPKDLRTNIQSIEWREYF